MRVSPGSATSSAAVDNRVSGRVDEGALTTTLHQIRPSAPVPGSNPNVRAAVNIRSTVGRSMIPRLLVVGLVMATAACARPPGATPDGMPRGPHTMGQSGETDVIMPGFTQPRPAPTPPGPTGPAPTIQNPMGEGRHLRP